MLTEKDYCDYDTCVALNKLGCPHWPHNNVYVGKGGLYCKCNPPYDSQKYNEGELISPFYGMGCYKEVGTTIPAITLYEAQKWLREEKDIHITINYICLDEDIFMYTLRHIGKKLREGGGLYNNKQYSSCEEALSEGIKEVVKILKKK